MRSARSAQPAQQRQDQVQGDLGVQQHAAAAPSIDQSSWSGTSPRWPGKPVRAPASHGHDPDARPGRRTSSADTSARIGASGLTKASAKAAIAVSNGAPTGIRQATALIAGQAAMASPEPRPHAGEPASPTRADQQHGAPAPTTRTRVPAGSSGPAASQVASAIRTRPWPGPIGVHQHRPRCRHRPGHGGSAAGSPPAAGNRRRQQNETADAHDGRGRRSSAPAAATPARQPATAATPVEAGGERQPQEHEARREHLQQQEHAAQRQPVPEGEGHAPGRSQGCGRSARAARGGRPPMASRASSAMPASEPSAAVASIGRIRVFWFGLVANAVSASRYFCAMK